MFFYENDELIINVILLPSFSGYYDLKMNHIGWFKLIIIIVILHFPDFTIVSTVPLS
jgi:hypothetical protein